MPTINEDYYVIIPRMLSAETALIGGTEIEMIRNIEAIKNDKDINNFAQGDGLVPENNFSWYAPMFGESVLKEYTELVSAISGKTLVPSYSYARIYYPGSSMKEHFDRPSCEYSMTIPLKFYGNPWNIKIKTKDGESKEVELGIGDAMFYQGSKIWHWRDKYDCGETQVQLFLHWVDVNGEYASFATDRRGILGAPVADEILEMQQNGVI
jgi:hypothetical protein